MAAPNRYQKALQKALEPIIGVWSDASISRVYGIPVSTVATWRERAGKPVAPGSASAGAKARGTALRQAVLAALWTRPGSRSGEVHERVVNSLGNVTQRQVIRVLKKLVEGGAAIREVDSYGVPHYRKTC